MGGGGVTAVRVAGKLSRINGGGGGGIIGSIKSVTPPEHFMSTTSTSPNRASSSKNVSVVANEDGGGKPAVLVSDSSLHISSCWEIDDWEFAGVEKERFFDSMNPISRVVFERVPTLEEAEEATSQLKQALDIVYIDATHKVNVKESTPSVDYSSGYTETRACVTPSQNLVANTSIPNPVLQALSLLQTSPECQHAVASIASDKTVWDAITQNPAVQDFIKSSQTSDVLTDMDDMEDANETFLDDVKASDCARSGDDEKHHEEESEDTANGFTEFMQKIKVAVTDMSSNLYGIVLSIIGGPTEENVSLDSKGVGAAAAAAAATEKSTAASLMVLAVMAIMVIVLKRV